MRARDLIAMASANHVDLLGAAKLAAEEQRKELQVLRMRSTDRKRTYDALVPPKANGANGRESRLFKRRKWSIEELSQAATGLPAIEFDVALYVYAGANDAYWRIWEALCGHTSELQSRYHWPAEIKDIHGIPSAYLRHMCLMVLDEDANEPLFKLLDQRLCSIYLRVPHEIWKSDLRGRYEQIRLVFIRWRDNALSTIQSRLEETA